MPIPLPYGDWNFHVWPAGRVLDWHAHTHLQIIHILDGELEVDWGDGWRPHRTGDAHVLPAGARHRLRTRSGHGQFGLNFAERSDERGLLAALEAAWPAPATVHLGGDAVGLDGLRRALELMPPEGPLRTASILDRYCLVVLAAARPAGNADVAQRLGDLLAACPDRPLAVTVLARRLRTARATVQRACRATFGCGVATLHRRMRLATAASRLVAGDATVGEIANGCGYADIFQFSRAFRRHHGLSPVAYRRTHRLRGG